MSSLKDKAIKGVFWSLIERFGNQFIQFFIGLLLARILMPEDYGILGMILIFISLAQVFSEGGFPSALIRKNKIRNIEYSTVFWFNLFVSIVCYIVLFLSASSIAKFFNEPQLISITKVVGLNIIINALGIIQKTILIKDLNFKSQETINLSSILVSGLIGLILAFNGMGVWSLVYQNLIRNLMVSLSFWIISSWRPLFVFSFTAFKQLFRFGSNMMLSSIINSISENLNAIIIGKLFTAKNLGFYTRANQFQKLPVSSVYGAIGAVSYPVLSELQGDINKLRLGYRSMIKMIGFTLFPIMAILAAVSDSMIHVVLTDKWLPASDILKVLTLIGLFYPLHAINLDILKIKGRSDLFLKLEIIKQILNVITILFSYKYGVMGLVWASVALNIVCFIINAWYSKEFINYSIPNQIKDLSIFLFLSVIIYVMLYFINVNFSHPTIFLVIAPLIGLFFYIFLAYLFKLEETKIIIQIISKFTSKNNLI